MTGARIAGIGQVLCLAGVTLGAVGFLGCITGTTFLRTVVPGQPPMMPNTAVALVLAGAAGALRRREDASRVQRTWSLVATVVVLGIGVGTLVEYALDVNLGIDELILRGQPGPHPGRPSPLTALAVTFVSAGLLLFDHRRTARARPSEWLVLLAWASAFTALLGFVFGAGALYRLQRAPVIGVALPTATSLLLTSSGLLLLRPTAGIMRVVTSPGPGGILLRRLALPTILAPALLGLVVKELATALGALDLMLVLATLAALLTLGGLLLLTVVAGPLNRSHEALDSARARTQALVEQASDGIFVADQEGRYTDVNSAACRMLGHGREDIVGKTIVDFIPPDDVPRLTRSREELLAGAVEVAEWTLRRKDGTYLPVEVSAKILPDGRWQGIARDIGERKRAEARLRETQERLALALRGANLGAWDWNVTSGEVIFSPRWAEMRGWRLEEITPHVDSWISGVHPDDWPRVQKVLTDHFEGRVPEYETEHRVRTASGEWIWVLDRGRVFARDEQGRPTRMAGTELDITDRKRLEGELRVAEAKSSGILSISADAMISIDAGQRITMFNEGAENIFGYSRAEVVGAPLDILIPERLRARHREHIDRFAAGPAVASRMGVRDAAIFGRRKNGEEFPADAAISKLDVGGTRILTVALRDITEQKRAESAQRFLAKVGEVLASTLEYEDTVSNIAGLAVREFADLCVVDVVEDDVVRRLKVVARDPSRAWICDLLAKVPPDERSDLFWLAPEVTRPVLMHRLSPEVVESLARTDEEIRALRALDLRSLIAVPLVARGKRLGTIGFASSTPSRLYGPADVHLAEELAHRAALSIENARLYRTARRAIQLRDEVLGIVAHDLRNPLNTIALCAQTLQRRGDEPEPRSHDPVHVIFRATSRMNRLIADLLDVSRMEAGRLSIERGRVPVAEIVEGSLEAQRGLASSALVELRCDVVPEAADVWADRDRLCQVFENLVGNALKFTQPGGTVTVGAAPRQGEVLFWVTDTGAGIASDDLPHVFDRFWQSRKGERQGAGLGLPIVKAIVEAHGGRAWAESTQGRGSTFFFTIPVPTAPPADQRQHASDGSA